MSLSFDPKDLGPIAQLAGKKGEVIRVVHRAVNTEVEAELAGG